MKKIDNKMIFPIDYWENEFREGWKNGEQPNRHLLYFLEKYQSKIGPEVLDIGSGDGRHLLPLARLGYQVTGLELTTAGILASQKKLNGYHNQVKLVQGVFHKLPFEKDAFDSAISVQALHYNNWSGALKSFSEISRVLKPESLFFFRARSEKGHWRSSDRKINDEGITRIEKRSTGFTVMVHDYTLIELEDLAELNNLKIISAIDEDKPGVPGEWNVVFQKK